MSTVEAIYELVKTMPEDRAYMVLKFVEFLRQEMIFPIVNQSPLDWLSDFFALYGSCANDEFEVDDAGVSDAMDGDLAGVFDE